MPLPPHPERNALVSMTSTEIAQLTLSELPVVLTHVSEITAYYLLLADKMVSQWLGKTSNSNQWKI